MVVRSVRVVGRYGDLKCVVEPVLIEFRTVASVDTSGGRCTYITIFCNDETPVEPVASSDGVSDVDVNVCSHDSATESEATSGLETPEEISVLPRTIRYGEGGELSAPDEFPSTRSATDHTRP